MVIGSGVMVQNTIQLWWKVKKKSHRPWGFIAMAPFRKLFKPPNWATVYLFMLLFWSECFTSKLALITWTRSAQSTHAIAAFSLILYTSQRSSTTATCTVIVQIYSSVWNMSLVFCQIYSAFLVVKQLNNTSVIFTISVHHHQQQPMTTHS